jgi:NodT family efflux transporter outer membrane factor (OMF) lipoprotein
MPRFRSRSPVIRRPVALSLALALLASLLACSHTPPTSPTVEPPLRFKNAPAPASVTLAQPQAQVPNRWWTLFNDPVLNAMQSQLLSNNLNLQSAAYAVASAQAAVAGSRAALLPQLNVGATATRSDSGPGAPASTTYALQGSMATWEVDLWRRIGQGVDAAQARLSASEYTMAATRLSLQASLCQTYFALRASEELADIIDQAVLSYQKSLELAQNRYQGGITSAADVAQAQTQLLSAQAQQFDARLQRAQLENALALLLGELPSTFTLLRAEPSQRLPAAPMVPTELPSQLLERRPEIAAAQSQIKAAAAQLGVTEAAFFPALTLSATGGIRSNNWRDLLQSSNGLWSLGTNALFSIFDGGARQANRDAARVAFDQSALDYRRTVLLALQEVEDNLAAASALQAQSLIQEQTLEAATRTLSIVQNQYKSGTVSYLNVVTAQNTVLSAQRSLLDVRTRRLSAVNQLLKNLAGRWS